MAQFLKKPLDVGTRKPFHGVEAERGVLNEHRAIYLETQNMADSDMHGPRQKVHK